MRLYLSNMYLFAKIFRNFARRQILKPTPLPKPKSANFTELLQDKRFLKGIGVRHFPLGLGEIPNSLAEVYGEDGEFLGDKTVSEARTLAEKLKIDIVLAQQSPLQIHITNFQQSVLKKIRLAQNKLARRTIKQATRTVKIKNNISPNDLKGKLIKIQALMEEFWKITILIEFTEYSQSQIDKSRVLALNIKQLLEVEADSYKFTLEQEDGKVFLAAEPDMAREKILNELIKNMDIFSSAGSINEYKTAQNKLEGYQIGAESGEDDVEPTEKEHIAYIEQMGIELDKNAPNWSDNLTEVKP